MLELTSDKDRKKQMALAMAKQGSLFDVSVSIGECKNCPLQDVCNFANETDITCRASSVAINQFEEQAARSPWIGPADVLGLRSLGAMYASIIIAELYFQKFGSIVVKTSKGARTMAFSEMHQQYIKILQAFNAGLDRYGLTPLGRRALKGSDGSAQAGTSLENYINAQYSITSSEEKHAEGSIMPQSGGSYTPPSPFDEADLGDGGESSGDISSRGSEKVSEEDR